MKRKYFLIKQHMEQEMEPLAEAALVTASAETK